MATTDTETFEHPGLRRRAAPIPATPATTSARAVFNGMIDRRPVLIARCAEHRRRRGGGELRPRAGAPALGLRRWPRRHRRGGGRRRACASTCAGMKGDRRRPRGADGRGRGGSQLGRVRRRHPGARARGHRRARARHRDRRARARQRERLARAQVRLHLRQPDRGRGGHRRRPRGAWRRPTENPDLFWGLRGGGGNFGIVTAFTLPAAPGAVRSCSAGMLVWPADDGRRRRARSGATSCSTAPDEVGSALAFITAPPAPLRARTGAGPPGRGRRRVLRGRPRRRASRRSQPLRDFGPPPLDLLEPMPYVALQDLIDRGNPHGLQNYWTADFLAELPDEAVDVLVEHATKPVSPFIADPARRRAAARSHACPRTRPRSASVTRRSTRTSCRCGRTPTTPTTNIAYTRAIAAAMKPWTTGEVYLNFIGDEGAAAGRVVVRRQEKYKLCRRSSPSGTPTTSSATTRTSSPRDPHTDSGVNRTSHTRCAATPGCGWLRVRRRTSGGGRRWRA